MASTPPSLTVEPLASRGSQKELSVQQEKHIAATLQGRRTINTGAGDKEKADILLDDCSVLVECKYTGDVIEPAKSISVKLEDLEKVWDQAAQIGFSPALAIRITNPDSRLSDDRGHVDWVAVPARDFDWYLTHGGKSHS